MYSPETQLSRTVGAMDAVATGRVLVVDDDRPFGGFMIAALETRGHAVDWAGCVADGLASLYNSRYDLVIVDLRLPDGSALDFLRQATDDGLLMHSSAVILTGHDFEEPHDIRVFRKPVDLDPFLDRAGNIIAHTQRRRRSTPSQASAIARETSGRGRPPAPKVDLVLYTSAASEKCQKAIRTIRAVLEQYSGADIRFTICDLARSPAQAEADSVVFTPTLVKRGPGPRTWIVGSLDQPDLLIDLLEVSGAARRK